MANINLVVHEVSGDIKSYLVEKPGLVEDIDKANPYQQNIKPVSNTVSYKMAHFYLKNNIVFVLLDTYLLERLLKELTVSDIYRNAWLANIWNLQKGITNIYIYEIMPEKPYIDSAWGKRLEILARERQELEHTMSWLSTLGGAFSALGEDISRCAMIAGRISIEQFRLATRLGDPDTQSRCRLYLALSLMQQGKLREAQRIIRREYDLALATPADIRDNRLVRMCYGMWAKLKYLHSLKRLRYR